MQVAIKNRYPDCLEIALRGIPSGSTAILLSLTAAWGEQWEPLLGGRVKFGLKGGQLQVSCEDGASLSERVSDVSESERASELPSLRVLAETPAQNERLWRFVERKGQILKGVAKLEAIALTSSEQLEGLKVLFSVEPADIAIAQTAELWKHDITPNQHAVLERAIAKFLQHYRLSPYLSLSPPAEQSQSAPTDETKALEALQQTIVEFSAGKTDNFLELAAIANLAPARDLSGGDLMATDLNGLDFSGTILDRVNLRGANLNDTDFSEASLKAARLMGADLSGAYLGNANLREANLHRASLALANLGGADASGANFQEVNLSNTNLAGVKVDKAIFGQNPGLTEDTKKSLLARGAIFRED
ncbi:pentapeptide repeat-containing protein [Oscillatoria sp. FACHB-1406]|uniref:pentapeptide repeat-containing protein n=1 Tax=Oscillatoria sp. FACHB-1406 TaxID=2692846 RepID=UPI0016838966|nr:pentapeptide repeat-containing protein [Oscillatoria sp. FACHB-1406]MBD2580545.1 pentapeptide repeat-containing protein [Oscillatoria sp. FACHB-1406]